MGEKPAGPPAPHDFFATRNVTAPILGAFGAQDRALAGRNPMALAASIDVHSHALPASYLAALAELGIDPVAEDGFPTPAWSEEGQLAFMEKTNQEFACSPSPRRTSTVEATSRLPASTESPQCDKRFNHLCQRFSCIK